MLVPRSQRQSKILKSILLNLDEYKEKAEVIEGKAREHIKGVTREHVKVT